MIRGQVQVLGGAGGRLWFCDGKFGSAAIVRVADLRT